jgi:hypothetical protein
MIWADNNNRNTRLFTKVEVRERDFTVLHTVQIGSGAHTTSCPIGTGGFFPEEVKRPGRKPDH